MGVKGNTFKRLWDKNEPVLAAIEDYSDLVCYGQIEQAGYSVGFYLLLAKILCILFAIFASCVYEY